MTGSSFGKLLKVSTWGESHGDSIGCIVDGVPSGIKITEKYIQKYLDLRKPGQSKFTTQRSEPDKVKILSGVFNNVSTGTPISLIIKNEDKKSKDYSNISKSFRPGHADFTYQQKFGIRDYRGGGRASARETAMRVAAGAIARKVLGKSVFIRGGLTQIGKKKINFKNWNWNEISQNPFFCPDKKAVKIWEKYLLDISPLTDNQELMFKAWEEQKNLFVYGSAGTGKTFIALYLALRDVLSEDSLYDKVYIVRSLVATREIGFLPGDHEDKSSLYQIPYKNMVKHMFEMPDDPSFEMLYANLKAQETISFWSTSFLRGTTLDNAIVIVDECENLNFHELDSLITRIGQDSKVIFAGDVAQTDLQKTAEKDGILDFQRILQEMDEFSLIEFGIDDIVRSGLVKSYIINKINLGL